MLRWDRLFIDLHRSLCHTKQCVTPHTAPYQLSSRSFRIIVHDKQYNYDDGDGVCDDEENPEQCAVKCIPNVMPRDRLMLVVLATNHVVGLRGNGVPLIMVTITVVVVLK